MEEFRAFTDQLFEANITAQDIAECLGVSRNTVLRARMTGGQTRPAPADWEPKLRQLAAERSQRLARLGKRRKPRSQP